ncbi:Gfo/Idh/MocA family protein [Paenibacillus koleovorans]|uniref:Gfo/Idh/MocA family protein n=1 Tax=Paenibacillus koleovorans TaxID=121608 RepID=UPI000FD8C4CD|nr:Gfo/Idh/MocA family oxidoreductase [Paenibacillus koleovorans]
MSQLLKVGIIGQGRSGRNIHAHGILREPEKYVITAVADGLEERRARAVEEFGCNAYATWEEMVENEQLDLVVNASPSDLHFPISLDLLNRGVNVLCEKPLAKTPEEVDQLIAASKKSGAYLAVFQQSRYMPAFQKIRSIIDSGVLGRIVQVDSTSNGFARRWDWQTLQSNNGGNLMNTGPHPVDQALQLFGTDIMPDVTCIMDRANTFGDAEDYVKIILRGPGRPVIDIEISSCSLFPRAQFTIQGTKGGLTGNTQSLTWKYFKSEEAPEQVLTTKPIINENGEPAYCREALTWYEEKWELELPEGFAAFEIMTNTLYKKLYATLTEGAALEITPEQVRQQMAVMEECRRQNPHIYTTA